MATYVKLEDLIEESTRYDKSNITFLTATDDTSLVIRDTDLFTIYKNIINIFVKEYTVTPRQREKYYGKPFLLSTDLYGTPDLGWLIIMLNDMECPSKFYIKSKIKVIPKKDLNELYDTIITKSNDRLNKNWTQYLNLVE